MTITLSRAKVLADRYAEVRRARGKSLEKSAAEMGLALRTCQRLANLAAGIDPDYSPDTATLDAVERWINTEPPPEADASAIERIVPIVRSAGLGIGATEAIVTAFRAVWGVALAHRPWYGNDEDARLLLACLSLSPTGQQVAAIRCGMVPESDRFVRARSALVALGLVNPTDGVLSLTKEGQERFDEQQQWWDFSPHAVLDRWRPQLTSDELTMLEVIMRDGLRWHEVASFFPLAERGLNILAKLIRLHLVVEQPGREYRAIAPLREDI